jgi:hypothetical protein
MNTLFLPPKIKTYAPLMKMPTVLNADINYLDVNKDVNLRKDVTKFFKNKIIKWIEEDANFKYHQSKLSFFKSTEGEKHIYNLLRKYIKKSNLNWYELRTNLYTLKEYFNKKL